MHFKKITMHTQIDMLSNAVVMGRKTFESLPNILPNRLNCVITKDPNYQKLVELFYIVLSQSKVVSFNLESNIEIEKIFIIGGSSIYKYCLDKNLYSKLVLTKVNDNIDYGDSFFPNLDFDNYALINRDRFKNIEATELKTNCKVNLNYNTYYFKQKAEIDSSSDILLNNVFKHEENRYLDILKKYI